MLFLLFIQILSGVCILQNIVVSNGKKENTFIYMKNIDLSVDLGGGGGD